MKKILILSFFIFTVFMTQTVKSCPDGWISGSVTYIYTELDIYGNQCSGTITVPYCYNASPSGNGFDYTVLVDQMSIIGCTFPLNQDFFNEVFRQIAQDFLNNGILAPCDQPGLQNTFYFEVVPCWKRHHYFNPTIGLPVEEMMSCTSSALCVTVYKICINENLEIVSQYETRYPMGTVDCTHYGDPGMPVGGTPDDYTTDCFLAIELCHP
jgi:hypothetical protein